MKVPTNPLRFDLETDGLLPELTKIHLVTLDDGDGVQAFHDDPTLTPCHGSLAEGLERVLTAPAIAAHNALGFDLPALEKVTGRRPEGEVWDTLVLSNVLWPDIRLSDFHRLKGGFPKQLVGRHSIEAWGNRLHREKLDFHENADWSTLTQAMLSYGIRDTEILSLLWAKVAAGPITYEAARREHDFAAYIERQNLTGVGFDLDKARAMEAELRSRFDLLAESLRESLGGGWTEVYYTPAKKLRREKYLELNPRSREMLARALMERRGWKPDRFTPTGKPQLDETAILGLEIPERDDILRLLSFGKLLGYLRDGNHAWIPAAEKGEGRIYFKTHHNGARTGRCTHTRPNLGQVPAGKPLDKTPRAEEIAAWEKRSRELFVPDPENVLVGSDLEQIEFVILAHYLLPYDGGRLRDVLQSGRNIHDANQEDLEIATRDHAKTALYATMYGAGPRKIARSLSVPLQEASSIRQRLLNGMGLTPLLKDLEAVLTDRRYLRSLGGRPLRVPKPTALLNTLVQGAAADIAKLWPVLATRRLDLAHTGLWRPVLHVHDELQLEVRDWPDLPQAVGEVLERAAAEAGEQLGMRLPVRAKATVGASWAETH